MSGLRFVGYRNNKLNRKGLKEIYKEAFPREEKIPFWMLKMLARGSRGEFYGVYDQDELAEHFAQLDKTYHALAERTDHNHKYKLHNSEYNRMLCEKLKKRGYITDAKVKDEYLEGYVRKK